MTGLSIRKEAEISPEDRERIIDGLRAHNRKNAPAPTWRSLHLLLRAEDGTIHGGLLAESGWEWMQVQFLWVDDALRGQGWGQALLAQAEDEARAHGCRAIWLDTHDFQAPAFYERQGYRLFGVLDDYPEGYRRFFYQKNLAR